MASMAADTDNEFDDHDETQEDKRVSYLDVVRDGLKKQGQVSTSF